MCNKIGHLFFKALSVIYTDKWLFYRDLERLGYIDRTVNRYKFIDIEMSADRNHMEIYCTTIKGGLKHFT